jgi:hypothetical protein
VIPVKLSYRPIPWLPFKKEIKTTHPEKWAELDAFQFADVVEFLGKPYDKKSHIALINSLLDLKIPLFDFPEEIIDLHSFIKESYPIRDWVIKSLVLKTGILIGPSDEFRNVTIGEFIFGDSFFLEYLKHDSEKALFKFLACFYRIALPAGTNDYTYEDDRVKFNPKYIESNAKYFEDLDKGLINAIVFNYKNIRGWIQDKYSWVFPKGSDESPKKAKSEGPWRKFAKNVIGGDYVNQDKRMQTLMHTILYDMNQDLRDQAKQRSRLKNRKHG